MTINGWIQIAIYCLAIIVCVKPLGLYMARVFEGEITFLAPLERAIYLSHYISLRYSDCLYKSML